MRVKSLCIALVILVLECAGVSQGCPDMDHEKAAQQFLLDHKSNSTAADRRCVDQAFTTLTLATRFKNKNYIPFLVAMLDFERWTPGYAEPAEPKYPAINNLHHLNSVGKNVIPYLISGIKQSESDVLRKNAAETLYYSSSACGAVKALQEEADKTDITYEQKERLEAATKHISELSHSEVPCDVASSKP